MSYEDRISKQTGETLAGVEFDTITTSPDGCRVILYAGPDVSREQIRRAEDEARRRFDVLPGGVTVRRVTAEQQAAEDWTADAEYSAGWVPAARWIVEHRTARRLDPKTGQLVPKSKRGGVMLDLFSASAMLQVFDNLSEKNKAKFAAMPLPVAHHVAFSVMGAAKKEG